MPTQRLALPVLRLAVALASLVSGCATAPLDSQAAERSTLRLVTYNIRHGSGMDDDVDLERTAAVLRSLDADLIALQEVDERAQRTGRIDQAVELGRLLGLEPVFGAFMDFQGGRYGMAFLSRHPIVASRLIELPLGNEPRIALLVELALPDGRRLTAVDVHFDWVGDDELRYGQARVLAEGLDAIDGPYVLLGDFNDEPGSRTLRLFHERALEARKPEAAHLTFPSTEPIKEIDFVFAAPPAAWTVHEVRVVDEPLASDHRPVLAVLQVR